jgi:DNA-binding IclR family transcriptional regulator
MVQHSSKQFDESAMPTSSNVQSSQYPVRSLVRGLRILRCFDIEHPEWSLGEVAKFTGLHKATAYRLLKTMESEGFVCYEPKTGMFSLGKALMPVAYLSASNKQLVKIARPHMERLSQVTGETVDLTVWSETGPVLVSMVQTSRPFKWVLPVGHVFPSHGNVHSKIFHSRSVTRSSVAHPPPAPVSAGGASCNSEALSSVQRATQNLVDSFGEGLTYDFQEHGDGVCALGAPVYGYDGEVRASLAVVAPAERFSEVEIRQNIAALKHSAQALSIDLGYSGF